MARVKFQIGDEVAVLNCRNDAMGITHIIADWFGNGWRTGDTAGVTHWSKTGLSRHDSYPGQRIVHATDEHRRALRVSELRAKLSCVEWRTEPSETIEAVAAIMGLQ